MWGSWVGAVVGFIFLTFPLAVLFIRSFGLTKDSWGCVDMFGCMPLSAIFTLILGFLIGWGIHSLIRKLRRKK